MRKVLSLKRLIETICGLVMKRVRFLKIILAMIAVVFLCVILSGAILIQFISNYPAIGETTHQVAPNSQANNTSPSQVTPNSQINITIPSQVAPNAQTNNTIPNVGILKTVGIGAYWDVGLTNKVSVIDWNILEPGDQKSFSIYIYNEGNSAVTLSLYASNWNPPVASNYLTLSWDYNGQQINVGGRLSVTLTLSVSPSITGITEFGFDIIIVGSG